MYRQLFLSHPCPDYAAQWRLLREVNCSHVQAAALHVTEQCTVISSLQLCQNRLQQVPQNSMSKIMMLLCWLLAAQQLHMLVVVEAPHVAEGRLACTSNSRVNAQYWCSHHSVWHTFFTVYVQSVHLPALSNQQPARQAGSGDRIAQHESQTSS
jgi:hypothetical protein